MISKTMTRKKCQQHQKNANWNKIHWANLNVCQSAGAAHSKITAVVFGRVEQHIPARLPRPTAGCACPAKSRSFLALRFCNPYISQILFDCERQSWTSLDAPTNSIVFFAGQSHSSQHPFRGGFFPNWNLNVSNEVLLPFHRCASIQGTWKCWKPFGFYGTVECIKLFVIKHKRKERTRHANSPWKQRTNRNNRAKRLRKSRRKFHQASFFCIPSGSLQTATRNIHYIHRNVLLFDLTFIVVTRKFDRDNCFFQGPPFLDSILDPKRGQQTLGTVYSTQPYASGFRPEYKLIDLLASFSKSVEPSSQVCHKRERKCLNCLRGYISINAGYVSLDLAVTVLIMSCIKFVARR